MNREKGHERWMQRAINWRNRSADIGLDSLLEALAHVMRPLGPLAAQVLWVAQPTLAAFSNDLFEDADALASLLEDPAALDQLLANLTSSDVEEGAL